MNDTVTYIYDFNHFNDLSHISRQPYMGGDYYDDKQGGVFYDYNHDYDDHDYDDHDHDDHDHDEGVSHIRWQPWPTVGTLTTSTSQVHLPIPDASHLPTPKKAFLQQTAFNLSRKHEILLVAMFWAAPTLFLPTGCDAEQGGQTVDSTMHCLCQLDKISFEVVLKFEICYVFYNLHIEQKKCTTLLSLQYLYSVLIPRV